MELQALATRYKIQKINEFLISKLPLFSLKANARRS